MSDHRSPEEIEDQIERERAELAGTLDTLQDRFSVDGMINQVSEHLRSNGGEIARNVSETVKQNPLGVALVGAGIAWLMFGKGPSAPRRSADTSDYGDDLAYESRYQTAPTPRRSANYGAPIQSRPTPEMKGSFQDDDPALDWYYDNLSDDDRDSTWESVKGAAHDGVERVGESWQSAKASASDTVGNAKAKATSAVDSVKAKASETAAGARSGAGSVASSARNGLDNVKDKLGAAGDEISSRAAHARARIAQGTEKLSEEARTRVIRARTAALKAKDEAAEQARYAAARSVEAYDRQPLAFGALAFAVGAAAAAALPRTERENAAVGAESDRLMRRAQRIFNEEVEKAKEVAQAAAEEAKTAIKETKSEIDSKAPGSKSAAEAAVDKVKETGNRVAQRAAQEAKSKNLGSAAQTRN